MDVHVYILSNPTSISIYKHNETFLSDDVTSLKHPNELNYASIFFDFRTFFGIELIFSSDVHMDVHQIY